MSKIKIISKRHFSAHKKLLKEASTFLTGAIHQEKFCGSGDFVAMVMCAFAIESLCNTAGEIIFPDWEDFENCNPKAKIRLICEKINCKFDKNQEPFKTLIWTCKFRNKIAHAKPEPLHEEIEIAEDEFENFLGNSGLQSKLEKPVSIERATSVLKAIKDFENLIVMYLPEDKKHDIASDLTEITTANGKTILFTS